MESAQPPLVAHIIYALGTGGLENGLVHLINGTPAGRYRHAIICLTGAEAFASRITAPDVEVHELGMRPGTDLDAYRRLRVLLQQLRPAIVHSRNLAALEAQLATLGLRGIRRVHGEHGRDMVDLDGSNWKYRLFRRGMRLVIDRYIAVSRDLASWLERDIGIRASRLHQIYNGVDLGRFQANGDGPGRHRVLPAGFLPEQGGLVVGTVGRLAAVKSQITLLEGVAATCHSRPDVARELRVVIVGEGALRPELESAARRLGLQDQLWMPGDRDDIPALLRAMDLFVLPSLGEGISNTVLEAMATGLPVVATRVGGNPELVQEGENGWLIPVGDARRLGEVLCEVYDAPDRRRELGANAQTFVSERFSWPRAVAAYLAVYDQLLGHEPEAAKGELARGK